MYAVERSETILRPRCSPTHMDLKSTFPYTIFDKIRTHYLVPYLSFPCRGCITKERDALHGICGDGAINKHPKMIGYPDMITHVIRVPARCAELIVWGPQELDVLQQVSTTKAERLRRRAVLARNPQTRLRTTCTSISQSRGLSAQGGSARCGELACAFWCFTASGS